MDSPIKKIQSKEINNPIIDILTIHAIPEELNKKSTITSEPVTEKKKTKSLFDDKTLTEQKIEIKNEETIIAEFERRLNTNKTPVADPECIDLSQAGDKIEIDKARSAKKKGLEKNSERLENTSQKIIFENLGFMIDDGPTKKNKSQLVDVSIEITPQTQEAALIKISDSLVTADESANKKRRGRPRKNSIRQDYSIKNPSEFSMESDSDKSEPIVPSKKLRPLATIEDDNVTEHSVRKSNRISARVERVIKKALLISKDYLEDENIIEEDFMPKSYQGEPIKRGRGRPRKEFMSQSGQKSVNQDSQKSTEKKNYIHVKSPSSKAQGTSDVITIKRTIEKYHGLSENEQELDKILMQNYSGTKSNKGENLENGKYRNHFNDSAFAETNENVEQMAHQNSFSKSLVENKTTNAHFPKAPAQTDEVIVNIQDTKALMSNDNGNEGIFKNEGLLKMNIGPLKHEHGHETTEKTLEQKILERKISIKKYGHFHFGDSPLEIVKSKKEGDFVLFTVSWLPRKDGYQPLDSQLTNIELRNYDKDLLLDYYETQLIFPNY